ETQSESGPTGRRGLHHARLDRRPVLRVPLYEPVLKRALTMPVDRLLTTTAFAGACEKAAPLAERGPVFAIWRAAASCGTAPAGSGCSSWRWTAPGCRAAAGPEGPTGAPI